MLQKEEGNLSPVPLNARGEEDISGVKGESNDPPETPEGQRTWVCVILSQKKIRRGYIFSRKRPRGLPLENKFIVVVSISEEKKEERSLHGEGMSAKWQGGDVSAWRETTAKLRCDHLSKKIHSEPDWE